MQYIYVCVGRKNTNALKVFEIEQMVRLSR